MVSFEKNIYIENLYTFCQQKLFYWISPQLPNLKTRHLLQIEDLFKRYILERFCEKRYIFQYIHFSIYTLLKTSTKIKSNHNSANIKLEDSVPFDN